MEHSFVSSNQNRGFRLAALISGSLFLVYVIINVFVIGGDAFVIALDDNLTILLALGTSLLALTLLNQTRSSSRSRLLWRGLFVGWALWTVAEIIWAVYGYLGQDVPFPSIADLFWLAGYIPLGFGLISRLREMPEKLSKAQKVLLWVCSLAMVAFTVTFVVLPIFKAYDASQVAGSIINIIYPLADLALLICTLRLVFVYRSGSYSLGWNLLSAGFVLMTVSDLFYSYLYPLNLYFPDGKVNLLSSLGNEVPYNLAYLVWIFGLYALATSLRAQRPFEIRLQPKPLPNTHILVTTRRDGKVIDVSRNLGLIVDLLDASRESFASLLNIPEDQGSAILEKIRQHGKTEVQHVLMRNLKGAMQDISVTGIAVVQPDGEFTGYSLLLRTQVESEKSPDALLSDYQKSVIAFLQRSSGDQEEAEKRQLLLDYYLPHLKQLYNLVYQTGGSHLGLLYREYLEKTARARGWKFRLDPQTLEMEAGEYPTEMLRKELPEMLEAARGFATRLTDAQSVETEINSISAQFSEAVERNVKMVVERG